MTLLSAKRLNGIVVALLSLLLVSTSAIAAAETVVDHRMILGPPMKVAILQGTYVEALNLAYGDWRTIKWHAAISKEKVTISPEPGTDLLYIRFVPTQINYGYVGGGDVLYTIDLRRRVIVHRSFPQ